MSNQIEEIVSEAYSSAFDALTTDEQERLLSLAVLGAPEHSFSTDWMLGQLVRIAGPESLPALLRWAAIPRPDAFSPQQAASCFLTGLAGCARLLDRPPDFGALTTDDDVAWATYGEMLFWLLRPGLTQGDRLSHCHPLWERLLTNLAFQAVDPLCRFATANLRPHEDKADALGTLVDAFPDEMRRVLTFSLRNHTRLTSLFRYPPHDGYLGFLIGWLGRLGDQHAVPLLEALLESPEVGQTAAEALRAIRSR